MTSDARVLGILKNLVRLIEMMLKDSKVKVTTEVGMTEDVV